MTKTIGAISALALILAACSGDAPETASHGQNAAELAAVEPSRASFEGEPESLPEPLPEPVETPVEAPAPAEAEPAVEPVVPPSEPQPAQPAPAVEPEPEPAPVTPDPEPTPEPVESEPEPLRGLFERCELEAQCPEELTCARSNDVGHDDPVCRPISRLPRDAACTYHDECGQSYCGPSWNPGEKICAPGAPPWEMGFGCDADDQCDSGRCDWAFGLRVCCLSQYGECIR